LFGQGGRKRGNSKKVGGEEKGKNLLRPKQLSLFAIRRATSIQVPIRGPITGNRHLKERYIRYVRKCSNAKGFESHAKKNGRKTGNG